MGMRHRALPQDDELLLRKRGENQATPRTTHPRTQGNPNLPSAPMESGIFRFEKWRAPSFTFWWQEFSSDTFGTIKDPGIFYGIHYQSRVFCVPREQNEESKKIRTLKVSEVKGIPKMGRSFTPFSNSFFPTTGNNFGGYVVILYHLRVAREASKFWFLAQGATFYRFYSLSPPLSCSFVRAFLPKTEASNHFVREWEYFESNRY